ncbi:helix-turn-helix transcriptional regulator [Microbacterium capsulatum]|uniref:Helix-turn-helix transcriptional regulator n=1 Tax=Microbacterium capsulatum TaxID=3041921 RepID=A0ABU0XDX4_9MICO|nr:helix-turn-helix transcriptional regulator [Microbacterium sp. ASV81]MDQ4212385.1 helix-turn-helix transcriptional regulator [Microbacterium sp. ASV81]
MSDAPSRAGASQPVPAAPHVRAAVAAVCADDPAAVAEVLAALTAEQRRGVRILPDPLPLVPAISARAVLSVPEGADPGALLALALAGEGRVDVLGALAGGEADRIALSPLAQVVEFGAGRFRLADPALRMHVLGSATDAERIAAHRRLAVILDEAGDDEGALRHRACGALLPDPSLVAPLLRQAREALTAGDAATAARAAAEAVDHAAAGTPLQAEALLIAGRAGLAGGWVADALDRVRPVLAGGGANRADAVAEFVLAHTLLHGAVPGPESLIPAGRAGARSGYRRAVALGAALSAQRGDREKGAAWLAAGGETGQAADVRSALTAWCGALAGDGADPVGDGDILRRVAHAIAVGLDGDPDAGVRILAEPDAILDEDPLLAPLLHGPLPRAARAVAEVLLQVWAGRIRVAHDLLAFAARDLPVALPFAGLAVVLARRLELAVNGRTGALSEDLATAAGSPDEADGFVDRAIAAYLHGRTDEAAVHLGLWADLGAPAEPFGIPGLDEVGPIDQAASAEPPETATARALRGRIRSAREASWRSDLESAAEEGRVVRSPFERARVEALLGSSYAARGDRAAGVRHLRAARSLFQESGARAWRRMVDRRLRRLGEQPRESEPREPAPGADASADPIETAPPRVVEPLEICRATWEPILTARELEVALLMAEGLPNREIALGLHVSVRTVEVHAGRVFAKLDVRTRHELTVLAHRTDQHL